VIFLTVGTWRRGYDRLVRAVDELVEKGVIAEEVAAQIGHGSYQPRQLKTIRFCSPDEFVKLISEVSLVISHAGMGTIIQAVRLGKPVIVVPRKASLGEADNDHQFTTAKQLEAEGKVLAAYEVSELPEKLEQAKTFVPSRSSGADQILKAVQEFIGQVANLKSGKSAVSQRKRVRRLWPYRILRREDDDIKADLKNIMDYFASRGEVFDTIVFIPNAGRYLSELFVEMFDHSFEINFITVRRASTVSKNNWLKRFIFKRRWLSDIFRHFEVALRLVKYTLRMKQRMAAELQVDFDVKGKKVLVIDDSCETGTTLGLVKSALLENGAEYVTTACITRDLVPDEVDVEYSVYKYELLRTKNSRDYYAT